MPIRPLLLIALLGALWPAQAEGRVRWKPLGPAVTPVFSDGVRWVAYQPTTEETRVIDTAQRASYSVVTPPECRPQYGTRGIVAIGGGQLMWDCAPRGANRPRLLDLDTRAVHDPVPAEGEGTVSTNPFLGEGPLLRVGKQWIERNLLVGSGKVYARRYINWRTGTVRTDAGTAREAVDLDSTSLLVPMCTPLYRGPATGLNIGWGPFTYDGRYGLAPGTAPRERIVLERCHARPKTFAVSDALSDVQLAGRLVTWPDRDGFHAYAPATRKRMVVNAPAGRVERTLNRIYVSRASRTGAWSIRYAAWRPPPTRRPG